MLSAALPSLAGIVLVLVLGLLDSIACDARDSTSDGTSHAVCASRGQVTKLSASLLLLASSVLLTAGLLEGLEGMLVAC